MKLNWMNAGLSVASILLPLLLIQVFPLGAMAMFGLGYGHALAKMFPVWEPPKKPGING